MPPSPIRSLLADPAALARAIEAETCRRSLAAFVRAAWPVVEPGTPLLWGPHMGAICAHLQAVTEGLITRLLINVGPGYCKSLLAAVLWPAWEWSRRPELRGLFGSYAMDLAIRDSVRCREVITSSWYRETFAPTWGLADDQNAKSYFVNTEKGFRFSLSVGSRATGWRGDKVVVDDPINAKEAPSRRARAECIRWWDKVMSSRLNDQRTGARVIIMQRLHDEDLSGHVLKKSGLGRYEHLCLPSEFAPSRRSTTSIGWSDPRTAEGELLFPALFPKDVLDEARKDLGPDGYAGQHQQSPAPDEGSKFKRGWFRSWEPAGDGLVRLLHRDRDPEIVKLADCRLFATVDLANSLKKSADYTVVAVWAVTPKSDLVLLDLVRDRLEDPDIPPAMVALARRYPRLAYFAVESNGIGLGVVQAARRLGLPVIAVEAEGDKVSRSSTAQIRFQAGQVFTPADAPWLGDYEHELLTFPLGAHDDQVDATSYAAIDVFRRGGAGEPAGDLAAREQEERERDHAEHVDIENPYWWGDDE